MAPAVLELPRVHVRGSVVLNMLHHLTAFQNEGFKSLFAKFLGGPASAYSRTNDDGIIGIFGRASSVNIHFSFSFIIL